MDPITTTTIVTGSAAWLLAKVLGPAAEYVGTELRDHIAERRSRNFERIITRAAEKLGRRIDEAGGVPPRILKEITVEGTFCDDHIATEYFAGVLAGSRSKNSDDDRGLPFLSLLSRLSTFDIRTHYILYHMFREVFQGVDVNASEQTVHRHRIWIPHECLRRMPPGIWRPDQMRSCIRRLQREGLIDDANVELYLRSHDEETCCPSYYGLELFRWAYGYSDLDDGTVFSPTQDFELHPEVTLHLDGVRVWEETACRVRLNGVKNVEL